jgi:hypothetical protein
VQRKERWSARDRRERKEGETNLFSLASFFGSDALKFLARRSLDDRKRLELITIGRVLSTVCTL